MELSRALLKSFAKITNDSKTQTKQTSTAYGTTVISDGKKYVQMDGSEMLTPVSEGTDIQDGDRVLLSVSNHVATVIGNLTCPASARTASDLVPDIEAASARIDQLVSTSVTTEYLSTHYASIESFDAVAGRVTTLEANQITVDTLKAKLGEFGYISAEDIEASYARLDKANIEDGWITTAMIGEGVVGSAQIADGSITDAKIVTLTANKLTSGTIDASQITVINLDCANLTVGTINGQQIAPGAIDLDNLSESLSGTITSTKEDVAKALEDAGLAKTEAESVKGIADDASAKALAATETANSVKGIADAANLAATSANATAEAAKKSADGKNTIFYQTEPPAGTDHRINDAWFDTNDSNKMYSWDGSNWVVKTFGNTAIANLDAGKITTGTLNADRIAANSIDTNKLMIRDANNYAQINKFNYKRYGISSVETSEAEGDIFNIVNSVTNWYQLSEFIPCKGGEDLLFKARVSSNVQGKTSTTDATLKYANVSFGVLYFNGNASGVAAGWLYSQKVISSAAATWTELPVSKISLPASARFFQVQVTIGLAVKPFTGTLKFSNLTVNRMASGELIVDGAITAGKVAAGAITSGKIAANAVTAGTIAAGVVGADQLAANAVTAGKIAANAVTTATIASGAVNADKIAAGAITAGKLAANSVTADNIVAGAVTAGKIASRSIAADRIATGAITATEIASRTITADRIKAGSLTATEINVANLFSQNVTATGTISGVTLKGVTIEAKNVRIQDSLQLYIGSNNVSYPAKIIYFGDQWTVHIGVGGGVTYKAITIGVPAGTDLGKNMEGGNEYGIAAVHINDDLNVNGDIVFNGLHQSSPAGRGDNYSLKTIVTDLEKNWSNMSTSVNQTVSTNYFATLRFVRLGAICFMIFDTPRLFSSSSFTDAATIPTNCRPIVNFYQEFQAPKSTHSVRFHLTTDGKVQMINYNATSADLNIHGIIAYPCNVVLTAPTAWKDDWK